MNIPEPIDQSAPAGWGDDPLSHFQSVAMQNEHASFVHARPWQNALSDVSADLTKCSDYAISNVLKADDPSALLLFMTAHNQFLASARLTLSGQCLAAYPTGRAALESALYGWYLAHNPGAGPRWHDKPTDRTKLKAWNAEFKFSTLASALSNSSEDAAKWAKYLHQTAIDFGAHPNREALYSNMAHVRGDDGESVLQMVFLHEWRSLSISTTKYIIEIGMFAISLFARAFPEVERTHGLVGAAARHARALRELVDTTAQFVEDDVVRANAGQ